MSFMQLIVEYNTKTLDEIFKKIDILEAQLLKMLDNTKMESFRNDIAVASKEWEKQITMIKSNIYSRGTQMIYWITCLQVIEPET